MLNYLTRPFRLYLFRNKWRKRNGHNQTVPQCVFPIDKVSVGRMSYGDLHLRTFGVDGEKLIIGDYVSIAQGVIFIMGGNHQVNTLSPYPLYSKLIAPDAGKDAFTKGPIIIENEAWIGFGAIILSGVKVGKGAVVAAGSVVVKDIPPYAIAGGNPAKVISYRFDEQIREALGDFSIAQLEEVMIKDNISDFYKAVDIELVEKIKSIMSKR